RSRGPRRRRAAARVGPVGFHQRRDHRGRRRVRALSEGCAPGTTGSEARVARFDAPDEAAAFAASFELHSPPGDFVDDPYPYYRVLRDNARVCMLSRGRLSITSTEET